LLESADAQPKTDVGIIVERGMLQTKNDKVAEIFHHGKPAAADRGQNG
jgi:hypothetical protein